jgi:hypothetical protein
VAAPDRRPSTTRGNAHSPGVGWPGPRCAPHRSRRTRSTGPGRSGPTNPSVHRPDRAGRGG